MSDAPPEKPRIVKKEVGPEDSGTVCDFLARHSGLPKMRIKDAMAKGAVWKQRKKGRVRVRRATAPVRDGDILELFYDPDLLSLEPLQARCVLDRTDWSIWFKPGGMLTQGTEYGDHSSLLRQVELAFQPEREVYPVHRLDREARGLVLIAHTGKAARELSRMFLGREVRKCYRAEVLGRFGETRGIIDLPIDRKPSITRYTVLSHDPATDTSCVSLEIETGRLHQIRRHLESIGHPVMGDPRYGRGNKDGKPMRLTACELEFTCPLSGEKIRCVLDFEF
jgi:tRNA pseudouridine32 synthase / 23S rRNA pseudouridine746 synthase